jgi:hypothetical protein
MALNAGVRKNRLLTRAAECRDIKSIINITAESANGEQNVDYSGALKDGYGAADLKAVAEKLQEIVNDGSLRMLIGELGFPTGQALIDWLKAAQKPFDPSYVSQG